MTKIVVAGAGFAGLACALRLEKIFRHDPRVRIILVDRRDYHLYTPNLYEAATAEEELVSVSQLKQSLVLPVKDIILEKRIEFANGEIGLIDQEKRTLAVGRSELEYDYLVLALGGAPDFLGVEGAEKNALPLGGVKDALRIRNAVEFAVQSRRLAAQKNDINFVIAGGGCAGVGIAGELAGLLDFLAWKNGYPRAKLRITLLESANRILPGLGDKVARYAAKRLAQLGVKAETGRLISRVSAGSVGFLDNQEMAQDVLVWTAGTRAAPLRFFRPVEKDKKGRLLTQENLLLKNSDRIFAVGELAAGGSREAQGIPGARQEGEYAAEALSLLLRNRRPPVFIGKAKSLTVAIGGKWAISAAGGICCRGRGAYYRGRLADFRYYRRLLGTGKALKFLFQQEQVFSRND